MSRIQLFGENAIPAGAHGIGRTWQATDQRTVGQSGQRPRLHGRSTDVGNRNLPEQLTKSIDLLVQQATHRLWRTVAPREPGTTSDQHHLYDLIGNPVGDLRANFVEIIFKQNPSGQVVTGSAQAVDKNLA
ncbi:hypothetical protein D3C85_1509380 [compost metagenome]